ncbi:hypothetical protein HN011_002792 [Eciton burchellii]|nr:hypothetical protein HN011_002792 [Eciton burchellii]
MVGQIQLILLAIVTLVHSNVADPNIEQNFSQIKLDKIVDHFLPKIRNYILKNGMDPMDLVDFSENIFPHMPGKLKGNIDFKKGWLQNLSNLKRSGTVIAEYKNKTITLNMNFGFDFLNFRYEYYLKHLLYKRQGNVEGQFYYLDVNTVITIDMTNHYLDLKSIKFSRVRKYDIKFEGHILDRILNALTKLYTLIFRKHILLNIENRSMKIFSAKINEWNKILPHQNRIQMIEDWLGLSE